MLYLTKTERPWRREPSSVHGRMLPKRVCSFWVCALTTNQWLGPASTDIAPLTMHPSQSVCSICAHGRHDAHGMNEHRHLCFGAAQCHVTWWGWDSRSDARGSCGYAPCTSAASVLCSMVVDGSHRLCCVIHTDTVVVLAYGWHGKLSIFCGRR